MTSFKVGDRVRLVDSYKSLKAGDMGTITGVIIGAKPKLNVTFDRTGPSTLFASRFERVDAPPLRPHRRLTPMSTANKTTTNDWISKTS